MKARIFWSMVIALGLLVGMSLSGNSPVYAGGPSKDWTEAEFKAFLAKEWTQDELNKMGRLPRYRIDKKMIKPRVEGDNLTPAQLYQNGKNEFMRISYQYGLGISAKDFYKLWIEQEKYKDPKTVLLDLRQESEFDQARIPGAKRLDTGLDWWQLPGVAPDATATYYLLCKNGTPGDTGNRGAYVKKHMQDMGYSGKIENITDGFRGWIEEGYPVINRHGLFTLVPGTFQMAEKDSFAEVKRITPTVSYQIVDLAGKLGIKDW
jgi:rhodanese-related sulfurtransferase